MLKTGIVLETNKTSVLIISQECELYKINNKHKPSPKIGDIYTSEVCRETKTLYKIIISLVSLALIIALVLFIINKSQVRYSAVIDVNTSIELRLNKSNDVVNVKPLSNRALTLTENLNLKHKSLNQAILLILEQAKKLNYIDEDYTNKEKNISIYISSHKNINIDFSSFQKTANSCNINITINDYGVEHKFTVKN